MRSSRVLSAQALLIASLAALWFILCRHLSAEWTYNEQYSYGWFVPFFAAFLFWLRWQDRPDSKGESSRNVGRQAEAGLSKEKVESETAALDLGSRRSFFLLGKPGLGLSAGVTATFYFLLLFVLFPIRLFEIANPGWRPLDWLHTSAVASLTLLAIYVAGGKTWLRHFAFPIGFFFVALPWFSAIEDPVIQGLMHGVAAIVSELLNLFGIPAQLEGSVIRVNSGIVGVNEACSGVRSLQTSLMIGLLFGELHRLTTMRRFALIAATIVLALLANLGRTSLLVWLAATRGLAAMEHAHDIAGYGVLLITFIGTVAIAAMISRGQKSKVRDQRSPVSAEPRNPSAAGLGKGRNEKASASLTTSLPTNLYHSLPPSSFLLLTFFYLLLVEIGAEAWYRSHERNLIPQPQWTVRWPEAQPGFQEIRLDERTRRMLRFDQGRGVIWRDDQSVQSASAPSVCLLYFFRWQSGHNSALLASLHRPDVCLPATGWRQTADHGVHYYPIAPDLTVPFRHFEFLHRVAEDRVQFAHAFYCLWEDRVRRIGNSTSEDAEMRRGPSEWTRDERVRIVLEGRRHLGQQVMEFVIASSQPLNAADAEARFGSMVKKLIVAPR